MSSRHVGLLVVRLVVSFLRGMVCVRRRLVRPAQVSSESRGLQFIDPPAL